MLDKNIIEESDSPYNSPVWVVPKKADASGKQKWRIVIDFRKLNELIDQDAYPLPNIDDILSQLGNAKFFSALDLSSGFHQIPMDENSKTYTAFSTPQGHFHYNRMPFGLKNAPATFQRMMDTALRGLLNRYCFVYLDDIIFGNTIQQHNDNLAIVLQRLRDLRLKIQPDKCEFLKPELEYLGHITTSEGIKPNPEKIEAVKQFKIPKMPTDVKSFLGLAGYYRKFIRNFSKLAKPLTDLTKKDIPFHWTDKQQESFQTLKDKLCEAPVLAYPNYNDAFTLTTDASNEGIGAILSQNGHPCCYISRTLNPPEKNYSTTEKELLAIVWAVKRLRQYLLGRHFIIRTDHQALTWLKNCKDPSSRLIRWRLKLEEYEYEIQYHKGKENTAADALSRQIFNLPVTENYIDTYT
ncbi:Retrovirus-related Pol polyprotein from transposon 17.6 [Anthophora quadrimaculata]